MYRQFFGLTDLPFELTPNPRFLYLPPQHQEALSALIYALRHAKSLAVLTGEAGLGKTTLLAAAMAALDPRPARLIFIKNPLLTRAEFLEAVARAFGVASAATVSKSTLLDILETRLAGGEDGPALLVADEAHVMPAALLEEIRLLGNIETATAKLLSVVLVGQPELADRLNEPSLRQLKQRVAVRCALVPLTADQTEAYIRTRLRVAGAGNDALFSRDAVARVHQFSGGIPRVINVICDNALVTAFATSQSQIDAAIVAEVARDFDLHETTGADALGSTTEPRALEEHRETSHAAVAATTSPADSMPPAEAGAQTSPRGDSTGAHDAKPMFERHAPVRSSFFSRVFSR